MKSNTVENIHNLVEYDENNLNKTILAENGEDMVILFALKQNQLLKTHTSPVDAFILVLEGEILFNIRNINHTISAEETLFLRKMRNIQFLPKKILNFW